MAENFSVLDSVLSWLRRGYPEGVPPKDYFPLLALLTRSRSADEAVNAPSKRSSRRTAPPTA